MHRFFFQLLPKVADNVLFALPGGAISQQVSAAAGGDLAVWQAPTFTKGKIPEEPPPSSLCV